MSLEQSGRRDAARQAHMRLVRQVPETPVALYDRVLAIPPERNPKRRARSSALITTHRLVISIASECQISLRSRMALAVISIAMSTPRLLSPLRVSWSITGEIAQFDGTLHDLGAASDADARLVSEVAATPGDEIRMDVLDESGAPCASGLASIVRVDPDGSMWARFVALGIDPGLKAALAIAEPRPKTAAPPPLPGRHTGRPPPLRLDRQRHQPKTLDDAAMAEIAPLALKREGIVIGIDLGTTNTCAAYVVDGRARVIQGRTGKNTIPSMITFDPDGTFHIGQRAADRQVLHPTRTVYGSKRLIGRTYTPELAAELQRHFGNPLGEAEGQRFGALIDGRVISMDTIAARVLDEVRQSVEAQLGTQVDAAVITVPAYFTEVQRESVRRAAQQARLAVFRIVNEPTAAAVAYGHKQTQKARIAVWDCGGGTFDFSIVDVAENQLEVVATGGDNFLGGHDFDDVLASHLLSEFCRIEQITIEPTPQMIARLREAASELKHHLSEQDEHVVELAELTTSPRRNLRATVFRSTFERLTAPLIERSVSIAKGVLESAGVSPSSIDDVVLVGGTTRIPAVQKAVAELFGRRPSKRINPDEAVALGAAMLAAEIGDGKTPSLVDILPMSVGRGVGGRRFELLAKRYTRVPSTHELVLDADTLGSVYVPLFQGDSLDVTKNEYLCSILVEDRSLWERGRVQLRIAFDEHCVMSVEAVDARRGRPLPVKLDRSRPVHDVLRDLGVYEGPEDEQPWKLPETPLGKVLGRLFRAFGG